MTPDFSSPEAQVLFKGIPEEYIVLSMEKVVQRFQFCNLEEPMTQSFYVMSIAKEAERLSRGESLSW